MNYNIAKQIEEDSIQLLLPFPELSNVHPLDKKMDKEIYPKFKDKLNKKGDKYDR